jgi:DNA processing protein
VNETEAFALLVSIPGLGAVKIRNLVEKFGSAVAAAEASAAQIQQLPGFERLATNWSSWQKNKKWQEDVALAERIGAALIPFTSPQFPKALQEETDSPALLYVQGTLRPSDARSIAIVGTRNASLYGREMAKTIASDLAANGFTVISGLARGIDTAAHEGALQKGRTIGVIGSGLNNIYPKENHELARTIAAQGALISEFPMNTPPDRQNFPQRNRIVSGMTLATVLIEAPIKSGAMLTMEKGWQQKHPLFALPGRADAESFRGNHLLIKKGKAHLIENAADILEHFQELLPLNSIQTIDNQPILLDTEEETLIGMMPPQEISLDELCSISHLPIHQVHRILMSLVLKKMIKEFPGKLYKKLAAGNATKRHN